MKVYVICYDADLRSMSPIEYTSMRRCQMDLNRKWLVAIMDQRLFKYFSCVLKSQTRLIDQSCQFESDSISSRYKGVVSNVTSLSRTFVVVMAPLLVPAKSFVVGSTTPRATRPITVLNFDVIMAILEMFLDEHGHRNNIALMLLNRRTSES